METQTIISFLLSHWLELTGATISLIWVYLEYRASIWLWPVGIILPIFYIAISWKTAFYGNIAVNIYYLITSVIGWLIWLRKPKGEQEDELPITNVPLSVIGYSLLFFAILYYPLYLVLKTSGSSLPWADTIATTASFIGMIWLSKKYRQVWYWWIIANMLSAIVFYQASDFISTTIFLLNLIMSILGYLNWTKLMRQYE